MQSLRLLIAVSLMALAAAQPRSAPVWDPTTRDKTEECKTYTKWAPTSVEKCEIATSCCSRAFDPLNGDKCQTSVNTCNELDDEQIDFTCTFSNCTAMITTTTTTTTAAPRVNAAPGASLFVCLSALLPRFLF